MKTDIQKLQPLEKLQIVETLMQEDRIEFRRHEDILIKSSYFYIIGLFTLSGFALSNSSGSFRFEYSIVGSVVLLFLYFLTFQVFKRNLDNTRRCLRIREDYYKNLDSLNEDCFAPLRDLTDEEKKQKIKEHNYLRSFPIVVVISTILVVAFLFISTTNSKIDDNYDSGKTAKCVSQ